MINYQPLKNRLKDMDLKISDLSKKIGISSRTIAKINRGEKIQNNVLKKISSFLKCEVIDLYKEESNNNLLQQLRDEKESNYSNGLYHELQVLIAYNSNHIEGSKLTFDQTRYIYETHSISSNESIMVDDLIETLNHFKCFDFILDNVELDLNENIIKKIHYILKNNTLNKLNFNIGEYKSLPNEVGGLETCSPKEVNNEMNNLLNWYKSLDNIDIKDIIEFHYRFERIHPFQDGNGRVGRLIIKECLKNNIIPFIILDDKKLFYYNGLKQYKYDKNYLIDTCLDGQDIIKNLINKFNI